ncbi:hypothetical protein G6O67_008211 [Ophiocordyceps sinensis]|uniref:Uncharacterized protein n=1 Tax=Ophiocordyceps sinensis TaxID=72228 RepID=A0A8H4PJY6_9HYPO|nr:hypothetical protein G6O67_008211 [Ophiocordyceps sinensis]
MYQGTLENGLSSTLLFPASFFFLTGAPLRQRPHSSSVISHVTPTSRGRRKGGPLLIATQVPGTRGRLAKSGEQGQGVPSPMASIHGPAPPALTVSQFVSSP